ncbi:sideroflexin-2 isoform X2 [Cimex lectularius]|uniref:Sidoreflexin n=1 Tax=Cimex lectularius TaxID=79782 RepID=A0A8I6S2V3_CIMLE|nr:sideroflexin-2 isoform X2 [Cimex lectularius]XP_014255182.1 sideroflexin-2 isoform X2 [Cimex lectularius]
MGDKRFNFYDNVWDQSKYSGRFKYFAWVTDPRLNFVSSECLDRAKTLRSLYLQKREPPGTTQEQLLYAKKLYDSAFHPDTGDKMNLFGRMSFQVPGGMLITGAMLTFYRTVPALVFWQWVNQSFNALVNYTNRNANSPLSVKQMGFAYVTATSAACVTAIGFKNFLMKRSNPFIQRYVPFAAVAAANCVNIPLMRQNELVNGIDVYDAKDKHVGESRVAALKGISEVILSRIVMCAPGMTLLPVIMERLERNCTFKTAVWAHAPFQTLMCGGFLLFMVPAACALFPQRCSLKTDTMRKFEAGKYCQMTKKYSNENQIPPVVYFNKGL